MNEVSKTLVAYAREVSGLLGTDPAGREETMVILAAVARMRPSQVPKPTVEARDSNT